MTANPAATRAWRIGVAAVAGVVIVVVAWTFALQLVTQALS